MWQSIADQVSATLHSQFVIHDKYALSGEPHAKRMLISDGTRSLFVKFAPRYELERLECQQHALEELGRACKKFCVTGILTNLLKGQQNAIIRRTHRPTAGGLLQP